ncbi:MAG: hypothetical protein M2R45_01594 [Verrucomicrobia subdivision 3 bacterium]|nr:hypothetical protein [Limisphaerales bacterium]MCS1412746.1 hypothetical protein [Limisphaerales bacterium]
MPRQFQPRYEPRGATAVFDGGIAGRARGGAGYGFHRGQFGALLREFLGPETGKTPFLGGRDQGARQGALRLRPKPVSGRVGPSAGGRQALDRANQCRPVGRGLPAGAPGFAVVEEALLISTIGPWQSEARESRSVLASAVLGQETLGIGKCNSREGSSRSRRPRICRAKGRPMPRALTRPRRMEGTVGMPCSNPKCQLVLRGGGSRESHPAWSRYSRTPNCCIALFP